MRCALCEPRILILQACCPRRCTVLPAANPRPAHALPAPAAPQMARQTLRGVRNEQCLAHLVSDDDALGALMASPDPPLHCLLQVQTRERTFRGEK